MNAHDGISWMFFCFRAFNPLKTETWRSAPPSTTKHACLRQNKGFIIPKASSSPELLLYKVEKVHFKKYLKVPARTGFPFRKLSLFLSLPYAFPPPAAAISKTSLRSAKAPLQPYERDGQASKQLWLCQAFITTLTVSAVVINSTLNLPIKRQKPDYPCFSALPKELLYRRNLFMGIGLRPGKIIRPAGLQYWYKHIYCFNKAPAVPATIMGCHQDGTPIDFLPL